MSVAVLPVIFRGLVWGHPGRPGGGRQRPLDPDSVTQQYRRHLPRAEVRDALVVDSEEEARRLPERLEGVDLLLVVRPELLSVRWAVKALEAAGLPIVLHGAKNRPGAVIADLYGYLRADGHDATLALDFPDIARRVRVVEAVKRLRGARVLVVGEGFPSWSQVANPTSPEAVEEVFGVEVVQVDVEFLFEAIHRTDRGAAEALAQRWMREAAEVTPEARNAVVEAAQTHLALAGLVRRHGAAAVTVDCRLMDELSVERHGIFYSPCMSLTVLRGEGVPAACEADVNALLSMMVLGYLADRPTFMGNLSLVDPEEGCIEIAHCAATNRMDGYEAEPTPYTLMDYHHRGTGLASYSRLREGQVVTVARLDKNLRHLSVAVGPIVDSAQGTGCVNRIRVRIGDARGFAERCLAGDHHAVVYGDVTDEVRSLCRTLGLGVLTP